MAATLLLNLIFYMIFRGKKYRHLFSANNTVQ